MVDDFGMEVLNTVQRSDLLEVLEDRYGNTSTIITSQLERKEWHAVIGDETIADAVLRPPRPQRPQGEAGR